MRLLILIISLWVVVEAQKKVAYKFHHSDRSIKGNISTFLYNKLILRQYYTPHQYTKCLEDQMDNEVVEKVTAEIRVQCTEPASGSAPGILDLFRRTAEVARDVSAVLMRDEDHPKLLTSTLYELVTSRQMGRSLIHSLITNAKDMHLQAITVLSNFLNKHKDWIEESTLYVIGLIVRTDVDELVKFLLIADSNLEFINGKVNFLQGIQLARLNFLPNRRSSSVKTPDYAADMELIGKYEEYFTCSWRVRRQHRSELDLEWFKLFTCVMYAEDIVTIPSDAVIPEYILDRQLEGQNTLHPSQKMYLERPN